MKIVSLLRASISFLLIYIVFPLEAQQNNVHLTWDINLSEKTDSKELLIPFKCDDCDQILVKKAVIPTYSFKISANAINTASISLKNIKTQFSPFNGFHTIIDEDFTITQQILYEKMLYKNHMMLFSLVLKKIFLNLICVVDGHLT